MDFRRPDKSGPVSSLGRVEWTPTARRTEDEFVVLPAAFDVALVEGVASVVVAPSGLGWVWQVKEYVTGGTTRYVVVPDQELVAYTDLVDVDPATLEPGAAPDPAWWAMAEGMKVSGEQAAAAALTAELAKAGAEGAASAAVAVAEELPGQAEQAVTAQVAAKVDPKVVAAQSAQTGAVTARNEAVQARVEAVAAKNAAEAVPLTNDAIMAGRIKDPNSATARELSGTIGAQVSDAVAPKLDASTAIATYSRPVAGRVALLGDSITDANSTLDGSNSVWQYSGKGWFIWANVACGWRYTLTGPSATDGEFGQSGRKASELLSLGDADAAAASTAEIVIVHIGTNDISGGATAATIAANILSIWRKQTARGKLVIGTTILPRNYASDTAGMRTQLEAANRLIRSNAAGEPGVFLCDWYDSILDPATGLVATTCTVDGLHPNSTGGSRMGAALTPVLASIAPKSLPARHLPRALTDSITPNPYALGNNSGKAASWTLVASAGAPGLTFTKVARTDGVPGEWQQINSVVTTTPAADRFVAQTSATDIGVSWSVGDTVYGAVEYEVDAGYDCRDLHVEIAFTGSAVLGASPYTTTNEGTALTETIKLPSKGVLVTPSVVVPAGATAVQIKARYSGSGTIRLGRMGIAKA